MDDKNTWRIWEHIDSKRIRPYMNRWFLLKNVHCY